MRRTGQRKRLIAFKLLSSETSATWDLWNKHFPSPKKSQLDLSHSLYPHFLRLEIGETSNKKAWKKKKKYRRLEHEWAQNNSSSAPTTKVNALNVTNSSSGARKDLNHITCFNYDKKGHYVTKSPKSRKDRDVLEN